MESLKPAIREIEDRLADQRDRVNELRSQLDKAEDTLSELENVLATLQRLTSDDGPEVEATGPLADLTSKAAVMWILQEKRQPMSVDSIIGRAAELGRDLNPNTVRWAIAELMKDDSLEKVEREEGRDRYRRIASADLQDVREVHMA